MPDSSPDLPAGRVPRTRAGTPVALGASREYKAVSGGRRRLHLSPRRRPLPTRVTQGSPHISPQTASPRSSFTRLPRPSYHCSHACRPRRSSGLDRSLTVCLTSHLMPLFPTDAPDMDHDHLPLFPTIPPTLDGQDVDDFFVAEWCVDYLCEFALGLTMCPGYLGSSPKPSTISSLVLLASAPTRRLRRPCRTIHFPFCTTLSLAARRPLQPPFRSTAAPPPLRGAPTDRTLTSMSPNPTFCLSRVTKTSSWTTFYSQVWLAAPSSRHGMPARLRSSRIHTTIRSNTTTGSTLRRPAARSSPPLRPRLPCLATTSRQSLRLSSSGRRKADALDQATAAGTAAMLVGPP
jgi:hypothetical protein